MVSELTLFLYLSVHRNSSLWLFPRLRVNRARECPLYNSYLVKLYFNYKLQVTYVTQQ